MTRPVDSERESAPPAQRLLDCLAGAWTTQAIYVAAELRLADWLAKRPHSSAELAAVTGTHEPSLRRLLGALTALGICRVVPSAAFELTPMGALLRTGAADSLHSWALWWGRSLWPAWGNLLHSVKTGQSARALLTGTRGFDHLVQDAEAAAIFYQASVELTRLTAPQILAAYDFSGLSRLVDVGGGYGELLRWVLRANPSMTGVLFDLKPAMAGAKRHLDAGGVGHRCELVEGDFFVAVPSGADAYILKSILHDWNDEAAGRILAACRRSMGENARLVLIEQLLPEAEASSPGGGPVVSDLTMLVAHGAGERTESELNALLHAAGFAVTRCIPVAGATHVIEAIPATHPAKTPGASL